MTIIRKKQMKLSIGALCARSVGRYERKKAEDRIQNSKGKRQKAEGGKWIFAKGFGKQLLGFCNRRNATESSFVACELLRHLGGRAVFVGLFWGGFDARTRIWKHSTITAKRIQ